MFLCKKKFLCMILEESIAVNSYIDDWFLPTDIWVHTYIHTYINTYNGYTQPDWYGQSPIQPVIPIPIHTSLLQSRNFQVPNPI